MLYYRKQHATFALNLNLCIDDPVNTVITNFQNQSGCDQQISRYQLFFCRRAIKAPISKLPPQAAAGGRLENRVKQIKLLEVVAIIR